MKLPQIPAAVVFDMDGLLFDTEALYQEAILAAAVEVGQEMTPAIFRRMLGNPWPANRDLLLALFGESFAVDTLRATWMQKFELLLTDRLVLKPGATELLDTLDELQLPKAIATSSSHQNARHHLTAHSLLGRFDEIVAHGDYARGKPAPDPFLRAAERLGVEPKFCLALEDSHNGVRSASSAGMMTIMVPDILEATDEIRELCTFVVADLHEVRRILLAAVRPVGSDNCQPS
jgi:HAD superfamily hydrolase (TIGR01509 family)